MQRRFAWLTMRLSQAPAWVGTIVDFVGRSWAEGKDDAMFCCIILDYIVLYYIILYDII